jgi:hypothetical protein
MVLTITPPKVSRAVMANGLGGKVSRDFNHFSYIAQRTHPNSSVDTRERERPRALQELNLFPKIMSLRLCPINQEPAAQL